MSIFHTFFLLSYLILFDIYSEKKTKYLSNCLKVGAVTSFWFLLLLVIFTCIWSIDSQPSNDKPSFASNLLLIE